MNQEWQKFLIQQEANLQNDVAVDFGNLQAELIAARDSTIVCDLSQFGTLSISGEEAQKFLQNLLSNDIGTVNTSSAQLSSLNSPKGRMLATFTVWQTNEGYYLQLPLSLAAVIHKKLSMFVLRSKVKVSNVSDDLISIGLAGVNAAKLIQEHFGSAPENNWSVLQKDNVCVIRLSANRYQITTDIPQATTLWNKFSKQAQKAGSACWDWMNIRDGIPVITPATQELFVLQMANLDVLGGVSFKKGCYPGQEIVARTHYLGKQKRRMFLAHIESDITPEAGNELFSTDMPDQPCGTIINASCSPYSGFDLLAVIQISSRNTSEVHLKSVHGSLLQFKQLPYTLPSD